MTPFRKTRIAPTPSGYLHAGNALNFLLTAALAERVGASVLLRIDDGDRERYRPAYVADIFETLHFLGIRWQGGPQNIQEFEQRWSQQHRLPLYHGVLKKLREQNSVFACTCSRTQINYCNCQQRKLPWDTPGASWRLRTDESPIQVKGLDGRIVTAPLHGEMKNFVVRRKDGVPAYQLASLVDDLHFGIDFIVRGQDLWPSTLTQQYLANVLGEERFSAIYFYHHPLLTNGQGEKLSKSAGAFSVKHWREQGCSFGDYLMHLGDLLHAPAPVRTAADLLAFCTMGF
jgi:glutamyl/glutaminyl-tRNA synthetase